MEFKPNSLLLVFAFSLLLPSIFATKVSYCDKEGNYAVKVTGVTISPDPVERGKPATFKISGTTGQKIPGGKMDIDVSFFSIHVHKETRNLCEEVSCPVQPGSFVLSHTQSLPVFTPPGSYTLRMTMKNDSDEVLTCISFGFKIGIGATVADS